MLIANMARQMQRPVFMPVTADFVGKISGSVVENPNLSKYCINQSALQTPSSLNFAETPVYTDIITLNSVCISRATSVSGQIPQQLFSFNLIEIFERKYGKIPASDVTGKVAWLKNNLNGLNCSWYGYGSCPTGNKAYVTMWRSSSSDYAVGISNTAPSPSLLGFGIDTTAMSRIDVNGFAHFLAYTDASDGVTASTIYTDYVNLVLAFKN